MIIRTYLSLILLAHGINLYSQDVYELWPEDHIPLLKENDLVEYELELWGTTCLKDITIPTLTVFRAEGKISSKAVLIVPGGGYEVVAIHHEGYEVAERLAKQGITAGVLKYRLPHPKSSDEPDSVPLTDARRALVKLRQMSEKYGFSNSEVGMMGFSAGGHLITVASLIKSDDPSENPDFAAPIYGVTILSETNLKWLEESLYYRPLSDEEKKQNTLLEWVSEDSPPAFLVHAYDDDVCNVEESTHFAEKLRDYNVKVEMHLFQKGGHGFGLGRKEDGTDQWISLFAQWLKNNQF